MRVRALGLQPWTVAALCLAALATSALATTQAPTQFPEPTVFHLSATPTSDEIDAFASYLGPLPQIEVKHGKPTAISSSTAAEAADLSALPQTQHRVLLRAPHPTPGLADWQAPINLATYAYPEVKGLADSSTDERSVPLGTMALMGLSPGGFGRIMTGRPVGGISNWTEASETSISYIRPHVTVQMMMAMELPGTHPASDFEGPGVVPHAYMDIDHRTRVDSADIGSSTNRFGYRPAPRPADEPETALSVGLDLGVLPTFLSQMGLSISVVAARGRETGNTTVALVGTTELPVDWAPRERPYNHPRGLTVDSLVGLAGGGEYAFGGAGGGGGSGPPGTPPNSPTPPTPVNPNPPPVPEPATLALLGGALAVALARRKTRSKP